MGLHTSYRCTTMPSQYWRTRPTFVFMQLILPAKTCYSISRSASASFTRAV
uniref:Uncharacterized protein n=1 Tax=Anguilla anguilla TaxID=7936 RepID=A0A0E9V8X0_ANGAN